MSRFFLLRRGGAGRIKTVSNTKFLTLPTGRIELARLRRLHPVAQCLLDQPQFLGDTGDAANLVGALDGLLLELSRVFLFRDAFHVVLPLVLSIVRRLRWKTKFGGQLTC